MPGLDRAEHEIAPSAAGRAGAPFRGANASGMRAHNERLVLSLLRRDGPLAKTEIARATGLSNQAVSVIVRALEADGLIARGAPVRGRVGQPSVPMRLSGEGALFFGLKIGRRSIELALVDFLGRVVAADRRVWRYPTPDAVVAFVAERLPALRRALPAGRRDRLAQEKIVGLGIAMPFQLWNWGAYLDAPPGALDDWRTRDIAAEIAALTELPVTLQNDATAACGAELVFGTGERLENALTIYFGFFIGGGLVLNGQLYTGRRGNAAGLGPLPVPCPGGGGAPLLSIASLCALAARIAEAGGDPERLWESPEDWDLSPAVREGFVAASAQGLASAILSASALLELDAVVIDGWLPADLREEIVARTDHAFRRLDLSGIEPLRIRAGTVGPHARVLGAAAIPLAQRYLVD